MAKKKTRKPEPTVESLEVLKQNLSKAELLRRIPKKTGPGRRQLSLEQKILILKLLHINGMDYSMTGREADVCRKSLYDWDREYGGAILATEPEYVIAETIQSDLNSLHSELVVNAYKTANRGLIKMGQLVGQASTIRQIYAIAEAIKTSAEVIKLDTDHGSGESDFAKGIIELFTKSLDDNGNKD